MNVSELLELTFWVTNEIVSTNIPKKYQALYSILQANVQPGQQMQPFESQKEDLIGALRKVPINRLSKDQLQFLYELGVAGAVGEKGIAAIEDILFRNALDIATAGEKLQTIHAEMTVGIDKSAQIGTGLDGCGFEEEYETKNEVLIRVSFTGNATMSNVADFKSWGNVWYEIGRGIAMAHNATPEEVKVVGATKGSIIIELAASIEVAATASAIVLAALKVAEKVLDIRKTAEEIRHLKLTNKKLASDLDKEAEKEKKTGTERITKEITKAIGLKKEGEGDKTNALERAVKNLVDFIETGGEVDFVIPEEDEEGDETEGVTPDYEELRVTFQEIRQLEYKIKLLEHKKE